MKNNKKREAAKNEAGGNEKHMCFFLLSLKVASFITVVYESFCAVSNRFIDIDLLYLRLLCPCAVCGIYDQGYPPRISVDHLLRCHDPSR